MNTPQIKIDGFRFIDNLHTTARQLPVFTAIVQILGNKQLTKITLQRLLISWSTLEELQNQVYKESKGKVTNNGQKTGALRYHIELSPVIGLTYRLNTTYQNTKSAKIFMQFLSSNKEQSFLAEKIFYLYELLVLDGDGILLLLSELNDASKSQSALQNNFKDALNNRLSIKRKLSGGKVAVVISEKMRVVNYIWKNAEKYAEHLIAPRYEWLNYLNIVLISRDKNKTIYSLSKSGRDFYNFLPNIEGSNNLKDVSNMWLNDNFISLVNYVYPDEKRKIFDQLPVGLQDEELGKSLQNSRNAVQSSMAFKLPLKDALLYISMHLLIKRNIIINFSSIINKLSTGFVFNQRNYIVRLLGRTNEGYITITSI